MRLNSRKIPPTRIIVTYDLTHFRAISPLHPVMISQSKQIAGSLGHLVEVEQ